MLLSVLNQEEMARLQENLEKLKAQGSEDDSEEKVNLKSRELNELKQRRFWDGRQPELRTFPF